MPKYKTVAAVLDATNDGRTIRREDVSARVLRAKVWGVGAGQPGCLYDYGPNYHRSKRAALEDAVWHADAGDGAPRGFKVALSRYGYADAGGMHYEVFRATIADMF